MKKQSIISVLGSVPLFRSLTDDQVQTVLLRSRLLTLKNGETLSGENGIAVVLRGSISAEKRSSGKKLIMRTFGVGTVSGVASLFSNGASDTVSTFTALSKSELLMIDQETVIALIHENGEFALDYIAFLTSRIRFLNTRIKAYTASGATSKLAMHLLISDEQDTGRVELHISLSKLADMLDMGRASLYRAIDDLVENGVIAKDGRYITILDKELLKSVSSGEKKL